MSTNNLYKIALLLISCTFVKCEIPQVIMTGSYDYDKLVSNFTCSVKYNASDDTWKPISEILELVVKYDDFEKVHISVNKEDNNTFQNAFDPVSLDREIFCRYLFHNMEKDQYVYILSDIVKLHKVRVKINNNLEKRNGSLTITTIKKTPFKINDTVYYTCESNNLTKPFELSGYQHVTKDRLEARLDASTGSNSQKSTFILQVSAEDHCTEIFCRAESDKDLNVLSERILVRVHIDGIRKCGPKKGDDIIDYLRPFVWYFAILVSLVTVVLIGTLYGIRDKRYLNLHT